MKKICLCNCHARDQALRIPRHKNHAECQRELMRESRAMMREECARIVERLMPKSPGTKRLLEKISRKIRGCK